jgi:8-oxo-dGTP diphosphatase
LTHYVAGFLFNNGGYSVVLVRKSKPEWQKGKLNAVGGKIDSWRHDGNCAIRTIANDIDTPNFNPCDCGGETPAQAMRREFKEEAGVDVETWKEFCVLSGDGFVVHFFSAFDTAAYNAAHSAEEEQIIKTYVDKLGAACLPNVKWLIPMALSMKDDRAERFEVKEVYA